MLFRSIAIGIDIENYGDHYDDYKSVGDEDNHLNQNQNQKKTLFLLSQSKKGIIFFISISSYFLS